MATSSKPKLKRRQTKAASVPSLIEATTTETLIVSPRGAGLVFISHDSRDADLAEAFSNLLTDVSGGVLKSFRASDKKGNAGIPFGAEWYRAIMLR